MKCFDCNYDFSYPGIGEIGEIFSETVCPKCKSKNHNGKKIMLSSSPKVRYIVKRRNLLKLLNVENFSEMFNI